MASAARKQIHSFRRVWTAFVVLATSLPYLWNYICTPLGKHYTWILPPYPEDSLAYLAWSQQAAHGDVLFKLKYTALSHAPFLFQPFFLIAGWIAAGAGCEIGIVHWSLKAMGTVLFFAVFYKYSDHLGLTEFQSAVASILVGISSGLGGLLAWLGMVDPLSDAVTDLWLVDSNTFWSLLWNPLFPYSLTLMLLTIWLLDRGTTGIRTSDFWFAGLATGVLALIHPYSQPLLFAFAAIVTTVRKKREALWLLAQYFSIAIPFTLYVVVISKLNPVVAKHSALGAMTSPSLIAYALGFGLPLLLWMGGPVAGGRIFVKQYWQVMLWFLLSVAFAYVPVWFQRKFIFSAHIPLCILAAISLNVLLTKYVPTANRKRNLIAIGTILLPLLASTPVYLLVQQRQQVRVDADGAYYITDDLRNALKFLQTKTKSDELVFASVRTSRLIPAFSGNTVLWGHWAQSVDGEEREQWFSSLERLDDVARSREFWKSGIKYIFADGAFREALLHPTNGWTGIMEQTDKVFANNSVTIYRHHPK